MSNRKKKARNQPDGDLVKAIIADANAGMNEKQIANKHKVNIGTVYRIRNREANKVIINNQAARQEISATVIENTEDVILKDSLKKESIEEMSSDIIEEAKDTESIEEETSIEVEEALSKPARKKRAGITPELKHNIIHDYFNDDGYKTSQADLALLYDISPSSVNRIVKSYNDFLHASTKQLNGILAIPISEQQNDDLPFTESKIKELNSSNYISLGLIAGRHDMGVDEFIFDSVDEDLMFDFPRQEKIAEDYLRSKIPFKNGKPTKGVYLYTSGLQSVLSSTNKVCIRLGIPLMVMHYNAASKQYMPQTIVEDDSIVNEVPVEIANVLKKHDKVRIYNCNASDIVKHGLTEDLYEIVECYYKDPIGTMNRSIIKTEAIIFISADAAWECFRLKAEEAVFNKSVFINISSIRNNHYYKETNLARISN